MEQKVSTESAKAQGLEIPMETELFEGAETTVVPGAEGCGQNEPERDLGAEGCTQNELQGDLEKRFSVESESQNMSMEGACEFSKPDTHSFVAKPELSAQSSTMIQPEAEELTACKKALLEETILQEADGAGKPVESALAAQNETAPVSEEQADFGALQPIAAVRRENSAAQTEYAALLREYPGLAELPQPVLARMACGETPLAAYRAYDNERLRAALAEAEAAVARKAAPASAAGTEVVRPHDFLSRLIEDL